MSRYRIRVNDEDEGTPNGLLLLAVGAIAGLAAGVYLSQRYGGVAGVTSRLKSRFAGATKHDEEGYDEGDEELEDEPFESANEDLEERVLSAFTNDPTLRERAVDIGAVAEHTIELTGHVFTQREADHAAVIARGVPGVEAVVNRLSVRQDEQAEETDVDEEDDDQDDLDDQAHYAESDWGDEDAADRSSPRPIDTHMAQDLPTEPPPPA
ncbi:MAG TPA: BON domain-containing protein [Gemmatimonadaceae bacterium]|nr:BON domain-containing protein [Gemmatimonadaceae bacterium]